MSTSNERKRVKAARGSYRPDLEEISLDLGSVHLAFDAQTGMWKEKGIDGNAVEEAGVGRDAFLSTASLNQQIQALGCSALALHLFNP